MDEEDDLIANLVFRAVPLIVGSALLVFSSTAADRVQRIALLVGAFVLAILMTTELRRSIRRRRAIAECNRAELPEWLASLPPATERPAESAAGEDEPRFDRP